jgi:stage II sporulation protein R
MGFFMNSFKYAHALKTDGAKNRTRVFELSLLIALCVSLLFGAWAHKEESRLAGKLIRLHVIANSDGEYDQSVKL